MCSLPNPNAYILIYTIPLYSPYTLIILFLLLFCLCPSASVSPLLYLLTMHAYAFSVSSSLLPWKIEHSPVETCGHYDSRRKTVVLHFILGLGRLGTRWCFGLYSAPLPPPSYCSSCCLPFFYFHLPYHCTFHALLLALLLPFSLHLPPACLHLPAYLPPPPLLTTAPPEKAQKAHACLPARCLLPPPPCLPSTAIMPTLPPSSYILLFTSLPALSSLLPYLRFTVL